MSRFRALAFCAGVAASAAHASDWSAPVTGSWTDSLMWTPNDVPDTDTESALVSAAGAPYEVTLDDPLTITDFTVDSYDATLTLNDTLQIGTPTTAGKLTFGKGVINGNLTIHGGPLEIGSSAGGTSNVTLISDGAVNINQVSGKGGNVPVGMTVDIRPLQDSSNLAVNVQAASFSNYGTLKVAPSLDNPVLTITGAMVFMNTGTFIANANAGGVGAVSFYGGSTFYNYYGATAEFHTSVFFTGLAANEGTLTVDANKYMQATSRFRQVAGGSLNVGLSLYTPIFEYLGGSVTGPVDTNHLILSSAAGGGTIRLQEYISTTAKIEGDVPTGLSVTADGVEGVTGVSLIGAALTNQGEFHVHQTTANPITISTNGMAGNGLLTNTGTMQISGGQALSFSGDYAQGATGVLRLELAGAEFDRMNISGNASLDGILEITLDGAFDPIAAPPEQQSFSVLTFASRTGEFETLLGRYVRDGYFWEPIYTATDLTLSLMQADPGDADIDGDVDLSDLGALATNYGAPAGADWIDGDFDHDGDVDLNDLGTLATNYGAGQAQAFSDFQSLANVPEPAGAVILWALAHVMRRRRRGS